MSLVNTITMPTLPPGPQGYGQITSDGVNVWTIQEFGQALYQIPYSTLNPITLIQNSNFRFGGISSDGINVWASYLNLSDYNAYLLQIDCNSGSVLNTINFGNTYFNNNQFPSLVSSDGTNVWVIFIGTNSFVFKVNCSSLIYDPNGISTGNISTGISSDGTNVWIANAGNNTVTQIDCNSGSVNIISTTSQTYYYPKPLAVSSDGTRVWVTYNDSSESALYCGYFVIDCLTSSIIYSVNGNNKNYINISGISSNGTYAYISNYNEIIILDAITFDNITSVIVDSSETIYYDGQFAWATNLITQVYQISTPISNPNKEITTSIYTTLFYSQFINKDLGSLFSSYVTPLTSPSFYDKFYCYIGGTQYELSQLFVRHSTPLSISPLNTGFFQIINNIVYDLSQIYVIYPFTQVITNPNLYYSTVNNYFYILFPQNTNLNSIATYGTYTINNGGNFLVSGYIVAGGGGGAPGSTNPTDTKGGGGGGGGETKYIPSNTTVISLDNLQITIGGGGSGGIVGSFGSALSGQNSMITINNNTLTANYGQGAIGGITAGSGGQISINGGSTTNGDGNPGTNGGGGGGGKGYDEDGLSTYAAPGGGGGGVAEFISLPLNFSNTKYGYGGTNPTIVNGLIAPGGNFGGGAGGGTYGGIFGIPGYQGGGGGGGQSAVQSNPAGPGGPGGGGWALIVLTPI
jgi:hypothetical protein